MMAWGDYAHNFQSKFYLLHHIPVQFGFHTSFTSIMAASGCILDLNRMREALELIIYHSSLSRNSPITVSGCLGHSCTLS